MCVCWILALAVLGQIVAPVGQLAAADNSLLRQLSDEIASVSEKAKPAVVSIITTTIRVQRSYDPFEQFDQFFSPGFRRYYRSHPPVERRQRQTGLGSGFLIDSQGTILTNNHVVKGTDELEVVLADGRTFKADVVGSDPETEVAVIKIAGKDLPYLELGDSDTVKVGNLVLAIGSPQGLPQTVTSGIVSALNRSSVGITNFADFIQTDAAVNPGSSGGPLLDADGKAIGINTAIYTTSGGSQGLSFAVPINRARHVAEALK